MADRPFLQSRKWLEQQWRADWTGSHPDVREFERLFIKRLVKIGVPMFTHECVRSNERQADLLALGHSKAGPGQSAHNFGCAIDLVHSTKAWGLSEKQWALIGHIGKELATQRGFEVVWGGDWNFYDPAHWELANWRELKEQYPWPK
ncbi:hypothetical protein GCM10007989_02770 [Devosia pacifica]|uniref:Peptidase M15C domain-containing protein n=1 Tax=Devosia pacifica TaxID=1335967 RepID=A0A918RUX2_9HYPH|nr:M15 family metallopeptidase [Devosia pacifica]GHA11869.1 hypothetical protein GCM10007989_02770 [Devosia pacifica]